MNTGPNFNISHSHTHKHVDSTPKKSLVGTHQNLATLITLSVFSIMQHYLETLSLKVIRYSSEDKHPGGNKFTKLWSSYADSSQETTQVKVL